MSMDFPVCAKCSSPSDIALSPANCSTKSYVRSGRRPDWCTWSAANTKGNNTSTNLMEAHYQIRMWKYGSIPSDTNQNGYGGDGDDGDDDGDGDDDVSDGDGWFW